MIRLVKYNTAVSIYTCLRTSGSTNIKSNPTLASGDVKISKDGGAFANLATLPDVIPAAGTQVRIQLSATEMQCKFATIVFVDQTATKEWDDMAVEVQTHGNASASLIFDLSQATPAVNVTQIDAQATNGNNATLNLKKLNIVNNAGDAIVASSTGSNGHGVNASGNGTGSGLKATGGATGNGILVIGGSTSGHAIRVTATSGDALNLVGGTSGNGIQSIGAGTGCGITSTGGSVGSGIYAKGNGSLHGISIQAGETGNGINILATDGGEIPLGGGSAIYAKSWTHCVYIESLSNSDGIRVFADTLGNGTGHGLLLKGSINSGHSMKLEAPAGCAINGNSDNGNAVEISSTANGGAGIVVTVNGSTGAEAVRLEGRTYGLKMTGAVDISAKEIGIPITLGDGASLAANMTSLAGKTASAGSYDRTTDSQEAIRDRGDAAWGTGGSGLTSQEIRDAMKLAPTAGAPAAGSVDEHLDDILTDTSTYLDATVSSRAAPGDEMNLVDDAIKAAKYDESTAFPIKSADTGSSKIARTGADSDTLETLSDQIDAVQSSVDSIQNNTRFVGVVPSTMYVPETGEQMYRLTANFYDEEGNMEDPDSNEIAVVYKIVAGGSKSAFYDDASGSVAATASSTFSGKYKMVRLDVGVYETYYKVLATDDTGQWTAEFSLEENSSQLDYTRTTDVLDMETIEVTLDDSTINKQIIAKALKDQDVSSTSAVVGSIHKDLNIMISSIPDSIFAKSIDGDTYLTITRLIRAMVKGRIVKEELPDGDYHTFYLPNATTPLYKLKITEAERTEI